MSKRRRAGAGRRIAEQRFWGGGGSVSGGPPAAGPAGLEPGVEETRGTSGSSGSGGSGGPSGSSGGANGSSGLGAAVGPTTPAGSTPVQRVRPTTDPAAVVRSLGAPPFAIDASVAERHLTAVYEEAVKAATALAAANGLLAPDEDDPDG